MEEPKDIKYSSYTEAQKRATKKYRENNKEKVNEQRKKYYQNRKTKDPNFLLYKRQKAKEYYAKKKERALKLKEELLKKAIEETELHKTIEKAKEEVKPPSPTTVVDIVYPILEEKKKRKYVKKQNKE
jgi:hypothetical protein